jgi:hypothetical protein
VDSLLGPAEVGASMKSRNLVLFSTEHCSLCERALDILFSMPELRGGQLQVVDVADDEALQARYGERLPVLQGGAGRELAWPFAATDVARWLESDQ